MATQNNKDSFPVDRPEASDTESDQEGKVLETHAITTTVQEITGFHLVEKKQRIFVDPKASESTLIHAIWSYKEQSYKEPALRFWKKIKNQPWEFWT